MKPALSFFLRKQKNDHNPFVQPISSFPPHSSLPQMQTLLKLTFQNILWNERWLTFRIEPASRSANPVFALDRFFGKILKFFYLDNYAGTSRSFI